MNPKKALTAVLVVFIGTSVVTLIAKGLRQDSPPTSATAVSDDQAASASRPDRVVVYYFHGKVRCPTCQMIETYAHEAVESRFPGELKDGRVQWKMVGYEEPGNDHFAKDYALVASSVVVVEFRGGVQKNWKNLEQVWGLVGNKQAFGAMVEQEIRRCL